MVATSGLGAQVRTANTFPLSVGRHTPAKDAIGSEGKVNQWSGSFLSGPRILPYSLRAVKTGW